MEFPRKSKSCKKHRNTASANDCPECAELNKHVCYLCKTELHFGNSSQNSAIEGDLPFVCDCFFKKTTSNTGEEIQTELPDAEICDSRSKNIRVKGDIARPKELSKDTEIDHVGSSAESEIRQFSQSSTGYISSVDELLSVPNLTDTKNTASPSSGEDSNLSRAIKSYSSGYPMSLGEKSSDQMNITSPSSGEGTKNTSNTERETSLDESGSNSNSDYKISDKYSGSPQSDAKPINPKLPIKEIQSNSSKNEQNTKDIPPEIEKFIFDNPDINISKVRPVLPRPFPRYPAQPQLYSQAHPLFPVKPPVQPYSQPHSQPPVQPYSQPHSQSPVQPYSQSHSQPPIQPQSVQPKSCSQPHFQFHVQSQPYSQCYPPTITSPSSSMQMPRLYPPIHPQPDPHLQSYNKTVMTKPVIQTNVPGRIPVSARPPYKQIPQPDGRKGLSKKLLVQVQKQQANSGQYDAKKERIKDWLDEVELLPPEEQPSDSGWASASAWSVASNEENEAVAPIFFSGTSTDERSSTEISEEENQRQRLLRRPPRSLRRDKSK